MNFSDGVKRYWGELDGTNVEFITDISGFTLSAIDRGIVYIHATWSAPSAIGLATFSKTVANLSFDDVRILILDNDALTEEFVRTELGVLPQGWGEVFWIKNGKVVATLLRWSPDSLAVVTANTVALIRNP